MIPKVSMFPKNPEVVCFGRYPTVKAECFGDKLADFDVAEKHTICCVLRLFHSIYCIFSIFRFFGEIFGKI